MHPVLYQLICTHNKPTTAIASHGVVWDHCQGLGAVAAVGGTRQPANVHAVRAALGRTCRLAAVPSLRARQQCQPQPAGAVAVRACQRTEECSECVAPHCKRPVPYGVAPSDQLLVLCFEASTIAYCVPAAAVRVFATYHCGLGEVPATQLQLAAVVQASPGVPLACLGTQMHNVIAGVCNEV
jgi:hypothetical protein